jgi:hypothetical protein
LRLSSQVAQEHHHPLNIWLLLVVVVEHPDTVAGVAAAVSKRRQVYL